MENQSFEEWLEEICKRPLPLNKAEQLETLAAELAEGSILGFWDSELKNIKTLNSINENRRNDSFLSADGLNLSTLNDTILEFIKIRGFNFNTKYIIRALISAGLAELITRSISKSVMKIDHRGDPLNEMINLTINVSFAQLSKLAFDLIKQKSSSEKKITFFISYKRKESSAFALLLLNLLKNNGFDPFLDLSIQPGDNWHSLLEEYIQNRDYFIVLIGKTTLESPITIKEIEWAIQYGRIIIPIWHNGFEFKPDDWKSLPDNVSKVLGTTHTIRITEESALAYHSALVELLNHFGITPSL